MPKFHVNDTVLWTIGTAVQLLSKAYTRALKCLIRSLLPQVQVAKASQEWTGTDDEFAVKARLGVRAHPSWIFRQVVAWKPNRKTPGGMQKLKRSRSVVWLHSVV